MGDSSNGRECTTGSQHGHWRSLSDGEQGAPMLVMGMSRAATKRCDEAARASADDMVFGRLRRRSVGDHQQITRESGQR